MWFWWRPDKRTIGQTEHWQTPHKSALCPGRRWEMLDTLWLCHRVLRQQPSSNRRSYSIRRSQWSDHILCYRHHDSMHSILCTTAKWIPCWNRKSIPPTMRQTQFQRLHLNDTREIYIACAKALRNFFAFAFMKRNGGWGWPQIVCIRASYLESWVWRRHEEPKRYVQCHSKPYAPASLWHYASGSVLQQSVVEYAIYSCFCAKCGSRLAPDTTPSSVIA